MRRFMVLPLAGLLALAIAAPVLAAPNVSNTSGSGKSIYGEWSSEGTYGYVFLGEEAGQGGFGDIYQESGEYVECDGALPPPDKGAPSPQDTTGGGEYYGFVGTRTYGWATDLTVTLSKRLDTGKATGSAELYHRDDRRVQRHLRRRRGLRDRVDQRHRDGRRPAGFVQEQRQLQDPVRVQRPLQLSRHGAAGGRLGRRGLDQHELHLRLHESGQLDRAHEQLGPPHRRRPRSPRGRGRRSAVRPSVSRAARRRSPPEPPSPTPRSCGRGPKGPSRRAPPR